jgi:hypothetical protein
MKQTFAGLMMGVAALAANAQENEKVIVDTNSGSVIFVVKQSRGAFNQTLSCKFGTLTMRQIDYTGGINTIDLLQGPEKRLAVARRHCEAAGLKPEF